MFLQPLQPLRSLRLHSGSLISLFSPGEGANQAEIVRDCRVSPVEWEEIKMKEVSYIVRNISIYDRHGHMVSVDQVN